MRKPKNYFISAIILGCLSIPPLLAQETVEKPKRPKSTKAYDRKPRQILINKRSEPIQQKYEDPNQPAAVRKTHRHPDADKLEIDFD